MDANRLVLLDRAENGDNGHSEETDRYSILKWVTVVLS